MRRPLWPLFAAATTCTLACGGASPSAVDAPATSDTRPGDGAPVSGPNIAFLSSIAIAPGALGSLAGADAWCGSAAAAAHHPGTYVAWLSSRTVSAPARITAATGGWQRVDGKPVAASTDQLVGSGAGASVLWYPLRLDENGSDWADAVAFTATTRIGTTSGGDCGAFGSTASTDAVTGGYADRGRGWADAAITIACGSAAHFYCLQVDGTEAVTAPAPPAAGAKLAFVSSTPFLLGGGVAAANAHCGSGSTVAWLATTGATPNSVVTGTGPWLRPDGVEVAPAGAWTGALEAPIEVDATGGLAGTAVVWTGADGVATAGSGGTCGDWGTQAGTGETASSLDSSVHPFGAGGETSGCATSSVGLFCIDN